MGAWGDAQIDVEDEDTWNSIASHCHCHPSVRNVNLAMDSFDLKIEGRRRYGAKSPWYSGKPKMNRPALRWMAIEDLQTRFRMLSGYYSPKVYNSHYILMQQRWCEDNLQGAVIVADQHFSSIKNQIDGVEVRTTTRSDDEIDEADPLDSHVTKLSKEASVQDQALKNIRSRVERPFGHIQNMFKILQVPWKDSWDQLNALVHLGAGIHNYQL